MILRPMTAGGMRPMRMDTESTSVRLAPAAASASSVLLSASSENRILNPDDHVHDAYVLSNERLIKKDRFITYLPIYFAPFIRSNHPDVVTL